MRRRGRTPARGTEWTGAAVGLPDQVRQTLDEVDDLADERRHDQEAHPGERREGDDEHDRGGHRAARTEALEAYQSGFKAIARSRHEQRSIARQAR